MNCPVCKSPLTMQTQFCGVCGANISQFSGIAPEKIIYNQTPEQKMQLGDDSYTQIIPENYGQVEGDDSITQLIPENYGQVEGDDSVTQLIPENYGQVEGDDSITQLIPENYGQVEGDDSVTQLIPENYGQVQGDDSITQLIPENYGQVEGDDSFTQIIPEEHEEKYIPEDLLQASAKLNNYYQEQQRREQQKSEAKKSQQPSGMNHNTQQFAVNQGVNQSYTMVDTHSQPFTSGQNMQGFELAKSDKLSNGYKVTSVVSVVANALMLLVSIVLVLKSALVFLEASLGAKINDDDLKNIMDFVYTNGQQQTIKNLVMCTVGASVLATAFAIINMSKAINPVKRPGIISSVVMVATGVIANITYLLACFAAKSPIDAYKDKNGYEEGMTFNEGVLFLIVAAVALILMIINLIVAVNADKRWKRTGISC